MAMRKLKELQEQAEELPISERLELARYLLASAVKAQGGEEALLSEQKLAEDWLRPEEDQAWRSL